MASQQSTDTTHNYRVLLKKQRVALVDQLNVSDGLYDHLIKYDIAGTREINRIKEEGKTREGQAALLLDYLETRPEKDLDKFVESLEKTNQGHLAKLFKSDSVKMSVRVTDIHEREQKPSTDSKLQLSETVTTPYSSSDAQLAEKRKIAESALLDLITKLSNECVENLSKMDENETKIDKLFGHIKILRGEHCSILLHIKCPNIAVLDYLWLLCETGGLTKIFQGYFVTDELLDKMDLSGMKLEAGMLLTDYMAHRNYLRIEETHYCKESTDSSEVSGPSMLKRPSYPLQIYRPDVAASTAIRVKEEISDERDTGPLRRRIKTEGSQSPSYQLPYDQPVPIVESKYIKREEDKGPAETYVLKEKDEEIATLQLQLKQIEGQNARMAKDIAYYQTNILKEKDEEIVTLKDRLKQVEGHNDKMAKDVAHYQEKCRNKDMELHALVTQLADMNGRLLGAIEKEITVPESVIEWERERHDVPLETYGGGITLSERSREPKRTRQNVHPQIYQEGFESPELKKKRHDVPHQAYGEESGFGMELGSFDEFLRTLYKDDSATQSTESDIPGSVSRHTGIGDLLIAADRHEPLNVPSDARKETPVKQVDPSITTLEVGKPGVPVQVEGGLYVMGGFTDIRQVTSEVTMSRIDGAGQLTQFTPVTPMPEGRVGADVAVVSGLVYVAGGQTDDYQVHSTLWRYTPATDTWTPLTAMSAPRSYFSLLGLSDCVVAVGGITECTDRDKRAVTSLSSCERYNMETDQWTEVTSLPAAVIDHCGCVVSDGNIYISGGQYSTGTSSRVLFYDPRVREWQERPPLLQARSGHVMVSWQDKLLVAGGQAQTGVHRMNILTTEVFDMFTQQWSIVTPPLTQGRVRSGSVVYGDRVYIVGGLSYNSDGTVSRHNTVLYLCDTKAPWTILPVTLSKPVSSLTACVVPLDSLTHTQLP